VASELQYQGRLNDPATGEPVTDGSYSMTFRLYDSELGITALWTETKDVAVQDGVFSTALGDTTELDPGLFNGQALWLGVEIGTDNEATPRQKILPVAYALSLVPGAQILTSSSSTALAVSNAGTGDALQVAGTTTLDGDLSVSGSLSGGSHAHWGESWAGSGVGLTLRSYDNDGLVINLPGQDGVHIFRPSAQGVYVYDPSGSGFYVDAAGTTGVSVMGAGSDGIHVYQPKGNGVLVEESTGDGFHASGSDEDGVHVRSASGNGLLVETAGLNGVEIWDTTYDGVQVNSAGRVGVQIGSSSGDGVYVSSPGGDGIDIRSASGNGVRLDGAGINGIEIWNATYDGVQVASAGRYGVQANTTGTYGFYTPDKIYAGNGYVDIAEHIDATGEVEPGDVVVIDPERDEHVVRSTDPYDAAVAGIISTDPAMVIGYSETRTPLALAGRVPCKVSAENGPIRRGDLLTTSSTPGHAMRANDPQLGTILGKAMGELASGTGVIPVLVTLQ
jgi:hypothetical protein